MINMIRSSSRLDVFALLAFIYFTVDVVTLWTRCWSFFALMNWSFVSGILNTAVLDGFDAHINQCSLLTLIQCHFFPLIHWYAELSCVNFYRVPKSFLLFWCVPLPFTHFNVKQLLWEATVIHSNDMSNQTKTTLRYYGFNA